MTFKNLDAVEKRLRDDPSELSESDVRGLMPWMNQISEAGMRRLKAQLSLSNIKAVQAFEKSTSRLTRWLIVLTAALLVLTAVTAYYSYVFASVARH